MLKNICLLYHCEYKIFMSCLCKTCQRTDLAHAGAGSQWVSRSLVGVRQTCCVPSSACLCFWGFLFSAPLVRMLSWDKYILCCPPTISLVNWVNTDSCFIIYKFCLLVSEWWWPNQSNTLSFTVWQTAWNCWHKQLVCFVLTLKKGAIWNLAYFKNTNSYLCLTDLITLRGPKFVILCKI